MAGLSLGLGLGIGARVRSGGSPPVSTLTAGVTFAWVMDGLASISGGVGPGTPNPAHQFMRLMGARVQPAPVAILALSGTSVGPSAFGGNAGWQNPYALDAAASMVPRIMIVGGGANDNLLSTDPGADPSDGHTTNAQLQAWYNMQKYGLEQFQAYGGDYYVIVNTPPSAKTNETTIDSGQTLDRRTRVMTAQSDFAAALKLLDSRVLFVSLAAMLPPSSFSVDGVQLVHFDERGGWYLGNAVKTVLDPLIEDPGAAVIRDRIEAGTYPLMTGAQADTDFALAGTGGTVTAAQGMTGTIATSKLIANTTGATGIVVSQVATTGGRTKTVVDLSAATPAATDGRILIQDKSNFGPSLTPGQVVLTAALWRAPAGFRTFGAEWGSFTQWGGGANSLADSGLAGANETHALDTLLIGSGTGSVAFTATTSFAPVAKRGWALFWKAGSTLSGPIELERPAYWKPSNRTAAAPRYIGDTVTSSGGAMLGANFRMQPRGTVSAASGGLVRVEPGQWNLFGFTETDYLERRIYKGSAGDTAIGSGTLLATLSGSTWTYTIAAAATTAGDRIFVEVDCNNGVGSTHTARSKTTLTVGA